MNLDDVYKRGISLIQGMCINLRRFTETDHSLVEKLFSEPSINNYFILRDDHRKNLTLFTNHLLNWMEEYRGFTFIIEDKSGEQTGFIVCEFEQWNKELGAFFSFAILPQYRNRGYATEALVLSMALMYGSVVKNFILDISSSNKFSSNIAKLLGFLPESKPLYDMFHPEVGVRYNWVKKAPKNNEVIDIKLLREKKDQKSTEVREGVYLGFESDNGSSLYWAKTNLIAKRNNIFCFADFSTYLVESNSYSEDTEDWDLFCWGDTTGAVLKSELNNPPLSICGNKDFDLVSSKIGSNWRLPSLSEFEKLERFCSCEWITDYCIPGMEFTSRINGQSIFLPALGLRGGRRERSYGGGLGCYWTGTLAENYNEPYYFYFGRGGSGIKPVPLYYGVSIRPVID